LLIRLNLALLVSGSAFVSEGNKLGIRLEQGKTTAGDEAVNRPASSSSIVRG
jgi:hypothetical protein